MHGSDAAVDLESHLVSGAGGESSLHNGEVSMGGVTFRISNFASRLEENITFTFYFFSFSSNSPCKKIELTKFIFFQTLNAFFSY